MTGPQTGRLLAKEDVGLLKAGDVLRRDDALIVRVHDIQQGDELVYFRPLTGGWAGYGLPEAFTFIGRPDADGWIAAPEGGWTSNPVPGTLVEVRREDDTTLSWPSDGMPWRHCNIGKRPVAFRIPSLAKPDAPADTGGQLYAVGGRVFRRVLEPDAPAGDVGESLDDAARRLFAVSYPGRDYDALKPDTQISWMRSAWDERLAALQAQPRTGAELRYYTDAEVEGGVSGLEMECFHAANQPQTTEFYQDLIRRLWAAYCQMEQRAAPSTLSQGTDAGLEAWIAILSTADDMAVSSGDGEANVGQTIRAAAREIATLRGEVERAVKAAECACGLLPGLAGADHKPDNAVYSAMAAKCEILEARRLLASIKSDARAASADLVNMKGGDS